MRLCASFYINYWKYPLSNNHSDLIVQAPQPQGSLQSLLNTVKNLTYGAIP